ncbi:glutathione-dependent formaldehyde-activating GFA [Hyaloscypha bicolor E]|uniref:Glutathione-dependent formaldehyde-activating GFA n=1 Tax=Hyaloscypha bicolor E TaxID=1095630 RepID=A0A2J6TJ21_9HELO|nr:glutathione-dependent formaldehyde-activating GFA [Hyaloscypha bicolor E]PMD63027.1 glutathione-dependent formaldehyde-activating GFA [Hyaloscypha bicolor E]
MTENTTFPLEGSCDCQNIRYRVEAKPLIVHCCHWCQRETGSAFALNAVIEATNITRLTTDPEIIHTPSQSGRGQKIARCPKCHIAVWSHYSSAGPLLTFVRVGTLENPDAVGGPGIHIFTSTKQKWVVLDRRVPVVSEFYDMEEIWSKESLERWKVLLPEVEKYRASLAPVES